MIRKILVALDDGIQSSKALDAAIEIAKSKEIEIYIVSSYSMPVVYQGTIAGGIYPDNSALISLLYENSHEYLEKLLADAAQKVRQENIPVFTKLVDGSPGRMITQLADELEIDLIAIGSHNRTGMNRFFMGSVSNYVLQHTNCLVLVAKDE